MVYQTRELLREREREVERRNTGSVVNTGRVEQFLLRKIFLQLKEVHSWKTTFFKRVRGQRCRSVEVSSMP